MSTSARSMPPADRYGRRPGGGLGRGAKAAIALALAAAVALAAWFAVVQNRERPVTADVVSFRVLSVEEIEVEFEVSGPAEAHAVCTLTALSPTFAVVASTDVTVGPIGPDGSRWTVTIPTTQRADAADIESCRAG